MEANQIFKKLRAINYRVVPEYDRNFHRFEIIIEPWDYENNKGIRSRKVKRSGVYFGRSECRLSSVGETRFKAELKRIQVAVINHYKNKQNGTNKN